MIRPTWRNMASASRWGWLSPVLYSGEFNEIPPNIAFSTTHVSRILFNSSNSKWRLTWIIINTLSEVFSNFLTLNRISLCWRSIFKPWEFVSFQKEKRVSLTVFSEVLIRKSWNLIQQCLLRHYTPSGIGHTHSPAEETVSSYKSSDPSHRCS